MGWADRKRVAQGRNGQEPKPSEPHAAWCERTTGTSTRCTCYPVPALQCNDCKAVFSLAPRETAIEFHRRVRAHAMVHPNCNPSFTQGRVEKTPRSPEGTDS